MRVDRFDQGKKRTALGRFIWICSFVVFFVVALLVVSGDPRSAAQSSQPATGPETQNPATQYQVSQDPPAQDSPNQDPSTPAAAPEPATAVPSPPAYSANPPAAKAKVAAAAETPASAPMADHAIPEAPNAVPASSAMVTPSAVPAAGPQDEQQKAIADSSANLLKLANLLKAEVDKTTADQLSVTVVRKAGEIEQLAHKMRNQ